jgi:hypothetical protein
MRSSQTVMRLNGGQYESSLEWGERSIPLVEQGNLLLSYYNEQKPFAYYSSADVLSGVIPKGSLVGKVAFVGVWASASGLVGDAIPLAGRLMALADVYDALISGRIYKPTYPHEKAKKIILEGKGTHFSPGVVYAFVAAENEFKKIAASYSETT